MLLKLYLAITLASLLIFLGLFGCHVPSVKEKIFKLTDLFPLTSRNPKSIVFRVNTKNTGVHYNQGADFYVFFPDENIYICAPNTGIEKDGNTHIGFYSLSSNENGLMLITKSATNHVVVSDNIAAESKLSLDSLYFCIKLGTTNMFNTDKNPHAVFKEPTILINDEYPALASNLITVQKINKGADSLNVIFTIPKLDTIKNIKIIYSTLLNSAKFDIDTIHNYYTQTGNICLLFADNFSIWNHHTVDSMPILALGNNKYQLKDYHTTPIYDTIQKKIMHIKLPYNFKQYCALNKFERAYIYALPQYIKALECAGTYPQK
jgi:hypothetical protein